MRSDDHPIQFRGVLDLGVVLSSLLMTSPLPKMTLGHRLVCIFASYLMFYFVRQNSNALKAPTNSKKKLLYLPVTARQVHTCRQSSRSRYCKFRLSNCIHTQIKKIDTKGSTCAPGLKPDLGFTKGCALQVFMFRSAYIGGTIGSKVYILWSLYLLIVFTKI